MCGIAGIYHMNEKSVNVEDLKYFTDSMTHRGPDDSGYILLHQNSLGLGHRRLSILDLSHKAAQPMQSADKRFHIVYNGEIFNFEEIKSELKTAGHRFITESDTEVILASYAEWGAGCLNRFNGMWAFAIWDDEKKALFLARDRFGVKPLYYIFEPQKRFAFASETRAFKYLSSYSRNTDNALLEITLRDSYALEGSGLTMFEGIRQLLPGHYMQIDLKGSPVQKRWWHIQENLREVPSEFDEQSSQFYELFRDACRLRLISDVPLATALSGGLDSTAVYTTVFDIISKESNGRFSMDAQKAFTAIFPGLDADEKEYAAVAAHYTGGEIFFIETDAYNLASRIEKETELADFINPSPISSISAVYEGMRKSGIKVSMDGHGVDEMLFGYRDMIYGLYNNALWYGSAEETSDYASVLEKMYHSDLRLQMNEKIFTDKSGKSKRESSVVYKLKRALSKQEGSSEYKLPKFNNLSDKAYNFDNLPLEERMVYSEFFCHTLPALLRNFDRAGMMHGVEIRMPFMDWRLVSYVFSLPLSSKVGGGFTKRILRESMKNRMPESLRTRTFKVGIGSPIETWLNGNLHEWAMDRLENSKFRIGVEKEWEKTRKWNPSTCSQIWQQINLKLIA